MQTSKDYLHVFLDMGDALLNSGAEIFRVEVLSAREVILSGQRRLSKILPVCRRAVHMPDVRRSADSILRRGFLHRARPQDTRS